MTLCSECMTSATRDWARQVTPRLRVTCDALRPDVRAHTETGCDV